MNLYLKLLCTCTFVIFLVTTSAYAQGEVTELPRSCPTPFSELQASELLSKWILPLVDIKKLSPQMAVLTEVSFGYRLRHLSKICQQEYTSWFPLIEKLLSAKESGRYFNLFFMLDYIYFQRKIDQYNLNSESLFQLRQIYLEKYLTFLIQEKTTAPNNKVTIKKLSDYHPDQGWLVKLGNAVRLIDASEKEKQAVQSLLMETHPIGVFELIFMDKIQDNLLNPKKVEQLDIISKTILAFKEGDQFWSLISQYEVAETLELMGVFFTQRQLILAKTIDWIVEQNLNPQILSVLKNVALAYFELERIGYSQISNLGYFQYISLDHFKFTTAKAHHFWSASYIGCLLQQKGMDRLSTLYADRYMITGYKKAIAIPHFILSVLEGRSPIKTMHDENVDIIAHQLAANWGYDACKESP